MEITQELLQDMFYYKEGNLYWKVDRSFKAKKGTKAGYVHKPDGYVLISLFNKAYAAHRLTYLYFHGTCPQYIDHINNQRDDNRIENLRPATRAQNNQNAKLRSDNSSGIKGVWFDKNRNTWRVEIKVNNKRICLGSYKNLDEACAIIKEARKHYHKDFHNHG